jgi:hypothetical protein
MSDVEMEHASRELGGEDAEAEDEEEGEGVDLRPGQSPGDSSEEEEEEGSEEEREVRQGQYLRLSTGMPVEFGSTRFHRR